MRNFTATKCDSPSLGVYYKVYDRMDSRLVGCAYFSRELAELEAERLNKLLEEELYDV